MPFEASQAAFWSVSGQKRTKSAQNTVFPRMILAGWGYYFLGAIIQGRQLFQIIESFRSDFTANL